MTSNNIELIDKMFQSTSINTIMRCKININDRTYLDWIFMHNENNSLIDIEEYPILKTIQPIEQNIFNKDVFEIYELNGIQLVRKIHSYISNCQTIAGILVLENNKTFGRSENKKRLLYKCIPDDINLPVFLVPYEVKLGFSKVQKNKYIVFKFDNWIHKHPYGIIIETIGDVDVIEHFYEYQLYSKSLHISITEFTNKTRSALNKKSHDEFVEQIFQNQNFIIEDRRDKYVFTIDPLGSLDYDDGFGIEEVGDNFCISIYIANVFLWLETLGLWHSFSQRVSTIYLPHQRRPMLPTVLSDALCSLQEKQQRFALVMDIIVDKYGNIISDIPIKYANSLISVNKNYVYEDPKMLNNDVAYRKLFDISYLMDNSVKNSHDVVSHWMIKMNMITGSYMFTNEMGIFRSAVYINSNLKVDATDLNDETIRVIRGWNNTIGQYVKFNYDGSIEHEFIKSKNLITNADLNNHRHKCDSKVYIHITSPIRRLVDLLNQIIIIKNKCLIKSVSPDGLKFLEDWIKKLDYINTSMRSIRKIQTECELLNRVHNQPELMESEHHAVVFDKIIKHDGSINYMIYLEKLKLLSRVNTHYDIENYTKCKCKMYLFDDEDKVKKKIRIQLL
jgi:exoribonuclease R